MIQMDFLLERVATPLGQMLIVTDEQQRLRALDWQDHEDDMHVLFRRQYREHSIVLHETSTVSPATQAMLEYFDGNIPAIDQIAVATGGTDFQQAVWKALREIPHGHTISYGTLAQRIGRPAAVRAVGMANGANPVSIVIPCHRVIGANQSLTGYGGGLPRKQWLLAHESRMLTGSLI
ncbi:methylated-DNA-[protein]-cysteine S-methyltransferase [Methylobacillus rhizosphaerae]|uniref:Methylated-DNA--protein-cysteine methyltransferase n=1 Tax=Methylobacillus rhizosphaerae TaxID=551994 RepID=A0A238ZMS1_9PROT|nr:methylated-DNA--[protein]-cysteine S-methyltransferase [Methylobacillus rhizosphaerae]SNR84746.1 methylated-DNA-[protein]-cysteine S-methyltransferase [Methylobacillus rhizosphaerae]